MTANHVGHEIVTFPGSPVARPTAPAVKREPEEDWGKTGGDEEAPYQRTSSKRQAVDRIRSAAEELVAGAPLKSHPISGIAIGEQADKMKDILGRVYECAEWNR